MSLRSLQITSVDYHRGIHRGVQPFPGVRGSLDTMYQRSVVHIFTTISRCHYLCATAANVLLAQPDFEHVRLVLHSSIQPIPSHFLKLIFSPSLARRQFLSQKVTCLSLVNSKPKCFTGVPSLLDAIYNESRTFAWQQIYGSATGVYGNRSADRRLCIKITDAVELLW